ncbi:MAG TPA: hypothetical protein VGF94_06730 [Kofleriaceae bacterium]|jgi:hypothetical protein
MNVMSETVFEWFLTLAVGLAAGGWLVYDTINLARTRGADGADPVVRDRRFGYLMGLVIGVIGVVGVLRYHGVL